MQQSKRDDTTVINGRTVCVWMMCAMDAQKVLLRLINLLGEGLLRALLSEKVNIAEIIAAFGDIRSAKPGDTLEKMLLVPGARTAIADGLSKMIVTIDPQSLEDLEKTILINHASIDGKKIVDLNESFAGCSVLDLWNVFLFALRVNFSTLFPDNNTLGGTAKT